jgi:DNA topoisomerase VI subunit B
LPGASGGTKSSKRKIAKEQVQKRSAADFFHDNKAIAGFDNPTRCVFTSIRELVENSLDAAEKMEGSDVLPEIRIHLDTLESEEIAALMGSWD